MYTFNQSTVYLEDDEGNDVDEGGVDVDLGEVLQFVALAFGGRPEPEFTWFIDERENDLLGEDGFIVSEGVIGCEDRYGYICNLQSNIIFAVDDQLVEILEDFGVDTDPEDGVVRFQLGCDVRQDDFAAQTVSTEIRIDMG